MVKPFVLRLLLLKTDEGQSWFPGRRSYALCIKQARMLGEKGWNSNLKRMLWVRTVWPLPKRYSRKGQTPKWKIPMKRRMTLWSGHKVKISEFVAESGKYWIIFKTQASGKTLNAYFEAHITLLSFW